ncbi:cadherin-related family member 3-like [Rana temporaria]|uniref:cadherin-related family member 3-like n=1 Tax=Rana temporaria TaxID=8407 RepID=UPI001AAC66E8|nr:cadherin-related family member 3-like [Rana temporaria]
MSLLRVTLLLSSIQVLSAAPTLFLPSNVTLSEDAPQSTLVAKMNATAAQHDRIVGAPFIVNSNPVVHPFIIIPKANNWELITTNTPKLNFEAVPLYTLQILVEDSKKTTATQSIVIEITHVNKAPLFTGTLARQDAELYIAENTAVSTVIYKVAAKDPDNDVLQYSIRITPGNSGFQIDNTGTISTTQMFDYESNTKSYTLTVTISDGTLEKSGNIKVYITNINDNEPTLTCVFSSITENSTSSTKTERSGSRANIQLIEELPIGTTVNTCNGFDADLMNDLTFYLDPGNPYFTIHKETGTVIIISIMDSEAFGFVSIQSYTVKVCDRDNKCASILVTATILPINDNPPFCDPYLYSFTNAEPIRKDTVVATLNCHDPDVPPNPLKYLPSNGPIGPDKLFQQTGNPNVIKVNENLVYDTDPVTTYEIMVSVSDSSDSTHTVTATIIVSVTPVNNFDPEFNPTTYNFTVQETAKEDTVLGQVTATDRDRPECITYSIRDGNSDIIHRFWINPTSGIIQLVTNPDYEIKPSYTMTIQATDCDPISPRKALAQVTVNIIEENDEAPVCKPSRYTAVIYDNITAGININNFRLNCKDRDSDDTAMRFEIFSGNINNHFSFDPTHGSHNPKLIVKSPFDFDNGADMQQRYTLIVHIIDDNVKYGNAQHPRTGTAMIDVRVVRTNTPAPPTTDYYKRKGLTIVNKDVNTYNPSAWYVPFLLTLMALLLAALFAWACHLIWKYTNLKALCQNVRNKVTNKRVKTYKPGTKKEKVEKITETTTYEPIFHGEAVDPVTGNTYEFNNKSGARRWKSEQSKDSNMTLTDISTVTEALPSYPPTVPAVNVT